MPASSRSNCRSHRRRINGETDNESDYHAGVHDDNGGGVSAVAGPGVGEALPPRPSIGTSWLGSAHQRRATRQRIRAAPAVHHGAERLLRDHRGEQGWRRWSHSHLRADRGQPPARPEHVPPVRVWRRHHRKPHQGRDVHLHYQGDRRGPKNLTLAYQITVTVQGPPNQLVCDPADNGGLPDQPGLRAARRRRRPALSRAPAHQPQGRRHAQRGLRFPAPGLALPATFTAPATSSAELPPTRVSNPVAVSPCKHR